MKYIICFISVLLSLNTKAQVSSRKLSTVLNHPSLNLYAPYISADANAIVFLSDNAEDRVLTPFYSFRENADWKEPKVLPKTVHSRLNHLRGYALSADGKKLYITTMKSPGVGGYDIWWTEWKGGTWTDPVNFALPINTKANESSPSFTPDGNTMYFMRCEKMDQNNADACKIFMAKKKSNGMWDEPVELPATINTGNSQTPRIMADGQTLIFSSNKMRGGKGGLDLYVVKNDNGSWSKPIPLDFVNTEKDDAHITVTALGRYLVRDTQGTRKSELMEYLIPNELRPKGMMKIDGRVSGAEGTPPSYISVIDLNTNKRIYNGRPGADGSFLLYLTEGSRYELSIDPEQANVGYFAKQFDLTSDKIPQVEKISATLKPLAPGDELVLDMIKFKPNSSDLDITASATELKRLVRAITGNQGLKFQIQILLSGYVEDTVRSSPDLTEVIYDSVRTTYQDIDTLGQLYNRDTVLLRTTYHNNRTLQQAEKLKTYLIEQGANAKNISIFGNAIAATIPENRKLSVKARIMN